MDTKQILLNLLFSIILFVLLAYLVGLEKLVGVLSKVKLEFIALALFCYAMMNVAMSYRIKVILTRLSEKLTIAQIIPSNLAGLLASDFTPARVGYFFTAFSLSSKFTIKIEKTIVTIFGPQVFDFLIKISSAAILLFLIMQQNGLGSVWVNVLLLLGVFIGVIFVGLLVFYPPLLQKLSFFERFPLVPKIFDFLRRMHDHSEDVLSIKWTIITITLVSWLIKGLEWLCLAKSLSITVGDNLLSEFFFMLIFQGALTIIQFLPIPTLAGAGASEAGFGVILLGFGVPLEAGVAFGLLTRLIMICVDLLALPVIVDYLHKYGLNKSLGMLDLGH